MELLCQRLTNVRRPSRSLANCPSLASGGVRLGALRRVVGAVSLRREGCNSFLENPGV